MIGRICPIGRIIGPIRPMMPPYSRSSSLLSNVPVDQHPAIAPEFNHVEPAKSNQTGSSGQQFLHHGLQRKSI